MATLNYSSSDSTCDHGGIVVVVYSAHDSGCTFTCGSAGGGGSKYSHKQHTIFSFLLH